MNTASPQDTERFTPLAEELCPAPDPVDVFRRLSARPHCLFLDSALRQPSLGRYSFVSADPFDFIQLSADGSDGLAEVERRMASLISHPIEELPPFQGGAAGLFSYDLGRSLERLPAGAYDEFKMPALAVGFYDVVVAFDHERERAWIISQGLPKSQTGERATRAEQRLNEFRDLLTGSRPEVPSNSADCDAIASTALAPQFPAGQIDGLTSDFTADAYRQAVRRAVEYVLAGDIFQVNLSQRLLYPAGDDSRRLYLRLRERNPAPFAGYFDLGPFQLVSASPERFVRVRDRIVEARPIKGTRGRTANPVADLYVGDDLRESEKDRAENVMIVDLLRNDLSRVCDPRSVQVTQLCEIEVYQYVQHLVSAVSGRLSDENSPIDLLRAAFPGGSITGAPKVRAMQIIAELEPTARGAYCGSLGYLGFDGTMDLSILIRTITAGRGWWQLPVGGGIIAQSDPQAEYEETWHKAEGLLRALN